MMTQKVWLYLKGICMGMADVIPGVSGGTMALILGIYEELIESIRRIDFSILGPLVGWVKNRDRESTRHLVDKLESMNIRFLVVLGAGIVTAVILGSLIVPPLLADYPVGVRGLFFGLILGSVWIPFTMLDSPSSRKIIVAVIIALIFTVVAFYLTAPNLRVPGSFYWTGVTSSGQTLGELIRFNPSAKPSYRVFWSSQNQSLRKNIFTQRPELAEKLKQLKRTTSSTGSGHGDVNPRSDPYESMNIPAGITVKLPRLNLIYLFGVAFIGISAMILPGISGSYILLIFGAYYYVTSSVKGLLTQLANGQFPMETGLIIVIFLLGLITGLAVLTRILNYLLEEWRAPTVGALTGLMIGCLRGVWPFRTTVEGTIYNTLPAHFDITVIFGIGFMLLGFLIVMSLSLATDTTSKTERIT